MPKTKKKKGISRRQQMEGRRWKDQYEKLLKFKDEHDHCNVSTYDKNNKELGNWVKSQRYLYKNGKLSAEQINCLQGIGFEWVRHKQVSWDERFQQLKQYKDKNGHCNVSTYGKVNPKLGKWVDNQRQSYKKESFHLNKSNILRVLDLNGNYRNMCL